MHKEMCHKKIQKIYLLTSEDFPHKHCTLRIKICSALLVTKRYKTQTQKGKTKQQQQQKTHVFWIFMQHVMDKEVIDPNQTFHLTWQDRILACLPCFFS